MRKILLALVLAGAWTAGLAALGFADVNDSMPLILFNEAGVGQELYCPVSGTPATVETINGLTSIAIECSRAYFYGGLEKSVAYSLWITNIADYSGGAQLAQGQPIGMTTKQTRILAVCGSLNEYLVRLTNQPPQRHGEVYVFSPWWIVPSTTDFLSFRQVDSFEEAVKDFYYRWYNEEKTEQNAGSTIHYFPDFDRIRVKVKLERYPDVAERNAGLSLTEMSYYRAGMFVAQNAFPMALSYEPIVYWQAGFKDYLTREYTLGDDLYLYCSIYTLDHAAKKIIVCARDFALQPDELVIEERLKPFAP